MKRRNKFLKSMRLGFFWPTGCLHITSKAVADAAPDWLDIHHIQRLARVVEEVGFDYTFALDFLSPFGPESTRVKHMDPLLAPIMVAPVIFSSTEHLGVITTIHTTMYHPAIIARLGADLDCLSNGRWGWNIVTGYYGNDVLGTQVMPHGDRYAAADEVVTIVKHLWTSEEPIDYEGKYHRAKGSIVGPKPVQEPWPLLVQAGGSKEGRDFAAKHADYNFMVAMSPESGAELLTDTRQRTSAFGRQGDDVKSQFAVLLFMRETDEEAHAFYQQVVSSLDTEAINEYKNAAFGPEGSHSARAMYDDMEEQEVLEHWGIGQGLFRLIGSPKTVAEELIAMYGIGLLDGFAVSFPVWHEWEIRNFAEKVLPILKSAGVWLPPWEREWCW